jgi:hypothetical protein
MEEWIDTVKVAFKGEWALKVRCAIAGCCVEGRMRELAEQIWRAGDKDAEGEIT